MDDIIKPAPGIEQAIKDVQKYDPTFQPDDIVINMPSHAAWQLKGMTFTEIMADVPPPQEFVISPILPVQGLAMIYAAQGVGKTLFTLNLAYIISQGGNFLNYKCLKPRKLLYVDAEMSYTNIWGRIAILEKTHGILDIPQNLTVITPDKILPYSMPHIDIPEGQQKYLEYIERENFEVIIFDNLSVLSSIDENKSNEWCIVQDFLLKLRALGKTVILVHHAGKAKGGYRGTSRMLDVLNTAISLQKVGDENITNEEIDLMRFKISYDKNRDFWGRDCLSTEVTLNAGNWTTRTIELSTIEKVLEGLEAGMTQKDIALELKISQPTVHRLAKKAGYKKRK